MTELAAFAALASASIALLTLAWTLTVFALGRVGDNRISANSVIVELKDSKVTITNFGEYPVRKLFLSVNGIAVPVERTNLSPKEGPLIVGLEDSADPAGSGVLQVELSYIDARGRWWIQLPGDRLLRYRHSRWRKLTRALSP